MKEKKVMKEKRKNNLNQMENGTRKTCVFEKEKTRGKRKTQREQSEKSKKGDEQMKKCKEEDKNQRR